MAYAWKSKVLLTFTQPSCTSVEHPVGGHPVSLGYYPLCYAGNQAQLGLLIAHCPGQCNHLQRLGNGTGSRGTQMLCNLGRNLNFGRRFMPLAAVASRDTLGSAPN